MFNIATGLVYRLLYVAIAILFLLSLLSGRVYADANTDRNFIRAGFSYVDYDQQICVINGSQTAATSVGLSSNVPDPWKSLIESTAPDYPDADPRLVAATLWAENRGWPEYKEGDWAVSESAAQGPWQFIPSTWASMGHDGDGDGIKDANNPKDAVHAAFKHQDGSAGKPILINYTNDPQGGYETLPFYNSTAPRDQWSLMTYMGKYNGTGVANGVPLAQFERGQNSDYVKMGYWLIATNFEQGWMPSTDTFVNAATSGSLNQANVGVSNVSGACPVANDTAGAVNVDGYAFPIAATKSTLYQGWTGGFPCLVFEKCHYGTAAFDLATNPPNQSTGTPVYAIVSGTIVGFKNIYKGELGCQSFHLKGDDNYYYYHTHIQGVTQAGKRVTAGQAIAKIGEKRCTINGSDPHLHIDRGPEGEMGGYTDSRDPGIIPLINSLYEGLPE